MKAYITLVSLVLTVGCLSGAHAEKKGTQTMLSKGDAAPQVSAPDTTGNAVAIHDALATGPVVLAFYPKAFTGG